MGIGKEITELASINTLHIILAYTILFFHMVEELIIETVFLLASQFIFRSKYLLVCSYSLYLMHLLSHSAKIINIISMRMVFKNMRQ